jgi:hypothetical protein
MPNSVFHPLFSAAAVGSGGPDLLPLAVPAGLQQCLSTRAGSAVYLLPFNARFMSPAAAAAGSGSGGVGMLPLAVRANLQQQLSTHAILSPCL